MLGAYIKRVWVENSTSLLYLPISSVAETWKFYKHAVPSFFPHSESRVKNSCSVGQGKKIEQAYPVRPNEKLICNFCHNLISTDKNDV